MGLMDKVKAQATQLADKAQTGLQQGQTKIEQFQTGKQADHLLRDLGAYAFLSERNRTPAGADTKVADIMKQLDELEASGTPVTVSPETPAGQDGGASPSPGGGATPPAGGGTIPTANDNLPG
jgi:hypothetical protein